MAESETLGLTNDQDIEHIVNRMRQNIPDIPYYLSVPSDRAYRILDPALTEQWRVNTWFEPHEEHLQYSTFVWRNPSTSLFRLNTFPDYDATTNMKMRSNAEPSPISAPKKKISLAAYNQSKSKMNETHSKPENGQNGSESSSQRGPLAFAPINRPLSRDILPVNGDPAADLHQTHSQRTKEREEHSEKDRQHTKQRQKRLGDMSTPWLPSRPADVASDALPPRLSPLVPEASILSMPSPGALQRHALSSLSGSTSSPLQITISLPSRFNKDTSDLIRFKRGANDGRGVDQEKSSNARHATGKVSLPSLIVKLRVPFLKQKVAQKRKGEDGSADELEHKRHRRLQSRADRDGTEKSLPIGLESANGLRASPVPSKNGPTTAEWQAEAQRLSRLGKRSKIASSDSSKQAEQAADIKDQARLRKIAAVQALESLLLFLQSFIAKTQSRPKLRALLADWETLLPYSTDVVNLARRFNHLEGLGLLLQSVASSQIVRICNSISRQQQQQQQQQQQDEIQDGNEDVRNNDVNDMMSTLQKYSFHSQQKAAEADRKLTRNTLSNEYPKAYAASLDQALGRGLQPMPAFRMAVLLIDEWSSHQGIEWQPIGEGLCKTLQ